MEDVAIYF